MKRKAVLSGPVNGPLREAYIDRGPARASFAGPGRKDPKGNGRVPRRQAGGHVQR